MMKFPLFPPFPLICPRASKKGENEKNDRIMLKWWKKGEKRNKWEKKREKRIKCEKMLKWWEKGEFGL